MEGIKGLIVPGTVFKLRNMEDAKPAKWDL